MNTGQWCELIGGATLTLFLLVDVFSTLLVPGPTAGRPSVLLNTRRLSLLVWHRASLQRRRKPGNGFAPFVLVIAFVSWMILLMLGFGMMIHALGGSFTPTVHSFAQSLYIAGSSMVTLGVSEVDATGVARWVLLAAGLAGFSVVTATITFSIQVQAGLRQREEGVLTLSGIAGAPPAGITIIETLAELGATDALPDFFIRWRDWAAGVLHSHTAYPVLAYFAATDPEIDWLAALEAVLDAATIVTAFTDDPAKGQAVMLHRTGSMVVTRLRRMARLEVAGPPGAIDLTPLIDRLQAAGFVVSDHTTAMDRFQNLRRDYAGDIDSIADHLGARRAVLIPQAERR